MSEYLNIIKESLIGLDEPTDPERGAEREALRASLERFDRRERAMRAFAWFTVAAMSLLWGWSIYAFFDAPEDESPKWLIAYAAAFLFAANGIWVGKELVLRSQNHTRVMKELFRVQLLVLERSASATRP